jgi:hypothetical protein
MGSAGALSSMDKAIDIVKYRSMQCFYFFIVQLVSFHLSSFLLMWICYDVIIALVVSIVLGVFFFVFMQNGFELYNQLYIADEDATSNKLMQDEPTKIKGSMSQDNQSAYESGNDSFSPEVRSKKGKPQSNDPLRVSNSKQHKYE